MSESGPKNNPLRCKERNAYDKRCVSHLNKEGTHKGPHTLNGRLGSWETSPYADDYMTEGEWQAYGRHGY